MLFYHVGQEAHDEGPDRKPYYQGQDKASSSQQSLLKDRLSKDIEKGGGWVHLSLYRRSYKREARIDPVVYGYPT